MAPYQTFLQVSPDKMGPLPVSEGCKYTFLIGHQFSKMYDAMLNEEKQTVALACVDMWFTRFWGPVNLHRDKRKTPCLNSFETFVILQELKRLERRLSTLKEIHRFKGWTEHRRKVSLSRWMTNSKSENVIFSHRSPLRSVSLLFGCVYETRHIEFFYRTKCFYIEKGNENAEGISFDERWNGKWKYNRAAKSHITINMLMILGTVKAKKCLLPSQPWKRGK